MKKQSHCKNCGKLIWNGYIRCVKCNGIFMKQTKKYKGKNNPNYKHGKNLVKKYCLICQKRLKRGGNICCLKHSNWNNKKEPRYCIYCKKKISRYVTRCRRCYIKFDLNSQNKTMLKSRFHNHHLYLRLFKTDKIVRLSASLHMLFHRKTYEYLILKHGVKEIHKYLKWFTRRYANGEILKIRRGR